MEAGATMASCWIGVDTGGTFTDIVVLDPETGRSWRAKEPTTPEDPAVAILAGVQRALAEADKAPGDVAGFVHGTTIATNAVLEGAWARAGMIATAGFSDILDLARQRRPSFFNLDIPKPTPPIPPEDRFEVAERLAHDGAVVTPLDETAVRAAAAALRDAGVEAVAICFLHSYANAAHEAEAERIVREVWPAAQVTRSAALTPEFREYERFAAAAVNVGLVPLLDRYIAGLEADLADAGVSARLQVMQSSGGATSGAAVRRAPIKTFFSGPAGGVIGAAALGRQAEKNALVTFDMGGTSTDVCLIKDGAPGFANMREMAGFPVRARTMDMHTIGAGGGSLAWLDPGGLLKVGPASAGARPGPAAYGRGGDRPTVTDANVILGRLNPKALLDGAMPMFPDKARAAMETHVAGPLGLSVEEAAAGVLEIVNVNMMGAVRVITVERGEDPRDAVLVPFGGAGPLHAMDVAAKLGMREAIVPAAPGVLSAMGLARADARADFARTRLLPLEPGSLDSLNRALVEMSAEAADWLAFEGHAPDAARFSALAEMRYAGQSYELAEPVADACLARAAFEISDLSGLRAAFDARHERTYGHAMPDRQVELVTLRLAVIAPNRARSADPPPADAGDAARPDHVRPVWFDGVGFVDTPVYRRDLAPRGARIEGPAIIEQMDATTVLPPATEAIVASSAYMTVRRLDGEVQP